MSARYPNLTEQPSIRAGHRLEIRCPLEACFTKASGPVAGVPRKQFMRGDAWRRLQGIIRWCRNSADSGRKQPESYVGKGCPYLAMRRARRSPNLSG